MNDAPVPLTVDEAHWPMLPALRNAVLQNIGVSMDGF